jgi:hypothetical protein
MVFQSYAIWPHLTVFENVSFPLVQGRFRSPNRISKKSAHCSLSDWIGKTRRAQLLSGGQQQRVALARALVGDKSNADPRPIEEHQRSDADFWGKNDHGAAIERSLLLFKLCPKRN